MVVAFESVNCNDLSPHSIEEAICTAILRTKYPLFLKLRWFLHSANETVTKLDLI